MQQIKLLVSYGSRLVRSLGDITTQTDNRAVTAVDNAHCYHSGLFLFHG